MIDVQRSEDRGTTRTSWLSSRHSFSFGGYRNPARIGFGPLLVLNEDVVAPGRGFPAHGHRDMEILTIVAEGALRHRDSLGSGSVLEAGAVQAMHAGTGVVHSEWNASEDRDVRFFQLWIHPRVPGGAPGYAERLPNAIPKVSLAPGVSSRIIAGPADGEASMSIDQDATVRMVDMQPDSKLELIEDSKRDFWIQVVDGELRIDDVALCAGDGAAVSDEPAPILHSYANARALLIDVARASRHGRN